MNRLALPTNLHSIPLKTLVFALCVCVAFVGAGVVWAQTGGVYSINWYSIDSGAGTLSGDVYAVRGTVGQPDAGLLEGDVYSLQGGISKTLIVAVPVPPSAPAAAPTRHFYLVADIPLSWSAVTWAIGYEVQVATNALFTTGVINSGLLPATDLAWTANVPGSGTYYWRVRAQRTPTLYGPYSPPQTFVVTVP